MSKTTVIDGGREVRQMEKGISKQGVESVNKTKAMKIGAKLLREVANHAIDKSNICGKRVMSHSIQGENANVGCIKDVQMSKEK